MSPVNVELERIRDRVLEHILVRSLDGSAVYLPHDSKTKLASYPFFHGNILEEFTTVDFEGHAPGVATACLDFQHSLGLRYLVIPTRYFDDLPDSYLGQLNSLFVQPFLEARHELGFTEPLVLTVIAKPLHLEPGALRDELLSWATSYQEVAGVYLIFDKDFHSKQIKDPGYLAGALRFIRALRFNDLEVHVGYCGLEGLLLSVADPTSVSVGSYENLRSFEPIRLETREPGVRRGPSPRIYSGRLLQWVEDTYLPPLRELTPNWRDLFDDSSGRRFTSTISMCFLSRWPHCRCSATCSALERAEALGLFDLISGSDVFLDSDSDHSHLPAWLNALAMFEARPE